MIDYDNCFCDSLNKLELFSGSVLSLQLHQLLLRHHEFHIAAVDSLAAA